ncbi:MAG: hypothetical protein ACKV19_01755 [Verrucomicrobiales bacterium]
MIRSFQFIIHIAAAALVALSMVGCTTGSEPKKKPKPPPPPPPGSELSSQPWARPEKDWEGGRPAFLPSQN